MHLVWFRKDLRVIDNKALVAATKRNEPVVAVYVATPAQWKQHHLAPIQADLILRRLKELNTELSELNIPLLYFEVSDFHAATEKVIELALDLGITTIHSNIEYELDEKKRDQRLAVMGQSQGIETTWYHDRVIFPPGHIKNKQNDFYKVFTPFKQAWLGKFSLMDATVLTPDCVYCSIEALSEKHVFQRHLFEHGCTFSYPRKDSGYYSVVTEDVLNQLDAFSENGLHQYHRDRDFPAVSGTSSLSPYLALGVISVRQCINRIKYSIEDADSGAQIWLSELVWREFYLHLIDQNSHLCKGQPYHQWGASILWQNDLDWFEKWKSGNTGYPIVDAAMRQLNNTGWMHNRLRMIVASFLTKDLLIDWRWGEAYFMSQLIDADYASNNGGWQWCASTGCDGQPYFRIFNPITQGEKFDPDGEFVRRWVPELNEVPNKYIHKPWQWNLFGRCDYCPPLVDHKQQRGLALEIYKRAKE